jgi:hypothetical protein
MLLLTALLIMTSTGQLVGTFWLTWIWLILGESMLTVAGVLVGF